MSKPDSYFDWQLVFRKKADQIDNRKSNKISDYIKKKFNSLGMSNYEFEVFMKKWKKKNL